MNRCLQEQKVKETEIKYVLYGLRRLMRENKFLVYLVAFFPVRVKCFKTVLRQKWSIGGKLCAFYSKKCIVCSRMSRKCVDG